MPSMTGFKLLTYEREGVNSNSIPNIWAVFGPALIEELQRHDPDFNLTMDDITGDMVDRYRIPPGQEIPIAELAAANVVFCINVPGNKFEAHRDEIEATLSRMLSGLLSPTPNVHVMLHASA